MNKNQTLTENNQPRMWAGCISYLFGILICSLLVGCSSRTKADLQWHQEKGYRWAELQLPWWGKAGFRQLSPDETGITFQNYLAEESYVKNQVLLNGSGVAAGDVN